MGTSGTPPQYVIVDRLGAYCVLLLNQIYLTTTYRSTNHSNLSDQSALEIRVKLRLNLAF